MRAHAGVASSAAQRARTPSSASDIRRSMSLDRDPQPVQQDEQDDDPGLEVRLAILVLCATMTDDFCRKITTPMEMFLTFPSALPLHLLDMRSRNAL